MVELLNIQIKIPPFSAKSFHSSVDLPITLEQRADEDLIQNE
jgi:hypothetical protein